MAQKRMFDKTITNQDNFLEMPDSTQNLYFHLSMEADDDGFVDNWKSIMRMTGKKEDDLKLLIAKSFIIPFESGVIVIKHWRINNFLRKDRYNETKYLKEKAQLKIEENREYSLKNTYGIPMVNPEENRIEENRIEYISSSIINTNTSNIFEFIEENFGRTLSSIEYEEISTWDDNELTRYAIKQSVLNGKYNIKYISRILFNYKKNNITTVQQAQQEEENFRKEKENKVNYKSNSKYQSMEEFNAVLDRFMNEGEEENDKE